MKYVSLLLISIFVFLGIEVVSAYDRTIKVPEPAYRSELMSEKWRALNCEEGVSETAYKKDMCGILAYHIDIQFLQERLDANDELVKDLQDRIKVLEQKIEEMKKEALKLNKGVNYGNRKQNK